MIKYGVIALLLAVCCGWAVAEARAAKQAKKTQNAAPAAASNAVLDAIYARRSIRNYEKRQLEPAVLDKILRAGVQAPSAMNRQDWAVRVLQKPEDIALLKGSLYNAPTVVLVATPGGTYGLVDSGLLAQNILLAAQSLGVGTCVVGSIVPVSDQLKAKLNLPEGYDVAFGVLMGYPAEKPDAKPRDFGKVEYIK